MIVGKYADGSIFMLIYSNGHPPSVFYTHPFAHPLSPWLASPGIPSGRGHQLAVRGRVGVQQILGGRGGKGRGMGGVSSQEHSGMPA